MVLSVFSKRAAFAASVAALIAMPAFSIAEDSANVQSELQALKSRISELEAKENQNWLNEERASQIKSLVQEVIADAKNRGQFLDGDASAGYDKGFFIRTADKKFSLKVNGYFQLRYTYASAANETAASFATDPRSGDANGFDMRRARLIFSGNAFDPNLTYLISGDFAGSTSNNFSLVDYYVAYKFSDLVNLRGGSFLVPFTKYEYLSSTTDAVELPYVGQPFDPVRSVGVSVFGQAIKDVWSYEVNVNNGQKTNNNGRTTQLGGSFDNRLAFYGRTQYVFSGKLADFNSEADLRKDNSSFIHMLGVAGGYESANATNTSFPGTQAQTSIPYGTFPSPGFSNFTFNGDLFRATADWSAKWQGWDFNVAGFFQQINQNRGVTLPAETSFFQYSYYGQVGYMVIPQKLQVFGQVGQFGTEYSPNMSENYTVGATYFLYGQDVKVVSDFTYIPNEAAYSDSSQATYVNTQDLIYRLQLQVKF